MISHITYTQLYISHIIFLLILSIKTIFLFSVSVSISILCFVQKYFNFIHKFSFSSNCILIIFLIFSFETTAISLKSHIVFLSSFSNSVSGVISVSNHSVSSISQSHSDLSKASQSVKSFLLFIIFKLTKYFLLNFYYHMENYSFLNIYLNYKICSIYFNLYNYNYFIFIQ